MPAFGPILGEEGVRNAAAYVRSLSGLPHDSLKAQLGKPIFAANCAACHGADGKGNQAIGAPNLTDNIWLYGSSETTMPKGITTGRHLNITDGHLPMPSFGPTLGRLPRSRCWPPTCGACRTRRLRRSDRRTAERGRRRRRPRRVSFPVAR